MMTREPATAYRSLVPGSREAGLHPLSTTPMAQCWAGGQTLHVGPNVQTLHVGPNAATFVFHVCLKSENVSVIRDTNPRTNTRDTGWEKGAPFFQIVFVEPHPQLIAELDTQKTTLHLRV